MNKYCKKKINKRKCLNHREIEKKKKIAKNNFCLTSKKFAKLNRTRYGNCLSIFDFLFFIFVLICKRKKLIMLV